MSSNEIVGRDAELAHVRAAVTRSAVEGRSLAFVGEPGIGKTALLDAADDLARTLGRRVLRTAGVEVEAHLPFAGLYQLLVPVLDEADALPEEERSALHAAFGLADGGAPEPYLIARATLGVVARVAETEPVVMLTDDVQWLDEASRGCLRYVVRRVRTVRLATVTTVRVERGEPRPPFLAAVDDVVTVGPLDGGSSAALLRGRGMPPEARVLRLAEGNPLALVELARGAGPDDDRAEARGPAARLERDYGRRAAALPPAARDLVLVAAEHESGALGEVMSSAAALAGRAVTQDDVAAARTAGLADVVEGALRFHHPLVRSGVLATEPLARRQAAHRVLADAAGDPYRRAWHRAQSTVGPDDAVADELEATVEESLRRGAVPLAVTSLERSAWLTGPSARRGRRFLRAAELAFRIGRSDVVDRLVGEAASTDLDDLDRARVQWLREIFDDGIPGDASRVEELCDVALAAAGRDDDLALNLLLGAALRCWWADTGPGARARVAAALGTLGSDDPRAVAALAVAEPVLRGAQVDAALAARPVAELDDAETLRLLGMAAHAVGDSPRADGYLTAAEERLRAQDADGSLAQALSMHTIVLLELGQWGRAAHASAEAMNLARETGQPVWNTGTLACEALAQALAGKAEHALGLVARAELGARRRGLNDLLSVAQLARGIALLQLEQPDAAFAALRRLFVEGDPAWHWRECFGGLTFLAEAAVAAGQQAEARRVVAHLEDLARVTPSPVLHAHLAYARAVLAPGRRTARTEFARALAERPGTLDAWPWVRARTRLAYGAWLRRHGRVADARAVLTRAAVELESIGAGHWAAEARRALTAGGGATTGGGSRWGRWTW
ncbi:MAG: AAA family ATPase [Promicromonosporaceae bacterium]|nr:AAA family ATPase [Promicromonosporaceae bacterium]